MLEDAREQFLDPNVGRRREGLEKMWRAFERVKTLEPGKDKKVQTTALLDRISAPGTRLRDLLET